jgi:hypothetical protein
VNGAGVNILELIKQRLMALLGPSDARIRNMYEISVPHPLRQLSQLVFKSDQKVRARTHAHMCLQLIIGLENAMDVLSSAVVMVGMIVAIVLATVFVVFQVCACDTLFNCVRRCICIGAQ